jgi:Mg-chelatase subunit ChlD
MKNRCSMILAGITLSVVLTGCAASVGAAFAPTAVRDEETPLADKREIKKDDAAADKTKAAVTEERSAPTTVDVSSKRGQKSGLQAGYVDDNKQFNRFTAFLADKKPEVTAYPLAVQERIIMKATDHAGKSLANARVTVRAGGVELARGVTYADGTFLFFPQEYNENSQRYDVEVLYGSQKKSLQVQRAGAREVNIALDLERVSIQQVPLDILFVFDTTSSMAEEIARLKTTIEIIYSNISYFPSKPKVRFGMVLYRDQGDEYVTRVVPLTADLEQFQESLDKVSVDGGGDWPEDLQAALKDSMGGIAWNSDGIRLAFIITDAQPHLDYKQSYTYVTAVHEAREKGIKIFSVGTGELPLGGEYVLRQISQYTYAKYLFLTYGERTDSEGGKMGSVSHHVGENYQTDKLEALVMQLAREELSHLTNQPLQAEEEYFQATKINDEQKTETLKKLFDMAFTQLADYSSLKLAPGTRVSVIPYAPAAPDLSAVSEYFMEQSVLSMGSQKFFTLVERANLQQVLKELEFQLSDLADESKAARLGKMLGAEVLVLGKVYRVKDKYEIFVKLVRVETAEILSVIKVKIDQALGL